MRCSWRGNHQLLIILILQLIIEGDLLWLLLPLDIWFMKSIRCYKCLYNITLCCGQRTNIFELIIFQTQLVASSRSETQICDITWSAKSQLKKVGTQYELYNVSEIYCWRYKWAVLVTVVRPGWARESGPRAWAASYGLRLTPSSGTNLVQNGRDRWTSGGEGVNSIILEMKVPVHMYPI